MQNKVVILGTGGTIAGTGQNVGYTAAQIGVAELAAAVPALQGLPLEAEQVAQVDSKDMSFAVWQQLAQRVALHVERADVAGVVVTHGTDTLEETAYFLHRVLAPAKPVVLTAAMRPATSLQADGPQNLLDAVTVAREPGARGVVCVLSGAVLGAADVRKVHTYRLDAFSPGDAGALALVAEGRLRLLRAWGEGAAPVGLARVARGAAQWPQVEVLMSHAGAGGAIVSALLAQGVQGIVVAATGNGSVHAELEAALLAAQDGGVRVLRSTRCAFGAVFDAGTPALPSAGALTPVQARIELLLELLAAA
jgi:L-asparaginase